MSRPERLELEGKGYGRGFVFSAPQRLCGEYSAELTVRLFFLRLFAGLLFLVAVPPAGAGDGLVVVPTLSSRVTDLTATLDASQKASLEGQLAAFEKAHGSQIAILMLPSTQPETIEQYGIRVAEAWKVGRKGKDDGVIVLVAKNDHKLRIEVGYGLEGGLNDAVSKRIVAETMAPHFKDGDWAGGLAAGVAQIQKVIEGEALPAPEQASAQRGRADDWQQVLMVGFVGMVVLGSFLAAILGRLLGGVATGGIVGIVSMVMTGSLLASGIAAVLVFLLMLGRGVGGGSRWHTGGWGGGMGGGGSWGGGSSGGWSGGGGGGFGGGGASGGW